MCTVLVVSGTLNVRTQLRMLRADMKADHETLGRAIGAAVRRVWRSDGENEALRMLASSNLQKVVHIRWIRLDAPVGDKFHPREPRPKLVSVSQGWSAHL